MLKVIAEQNAILIVYLLVGLALTHWGQLNKNNLTNLSMLLTDALLPCAILSSFLTDYSREKMRLVFVTFILSFVLMLLVMTTSYLITRLFRIKGKLAKVWIGCCSFSNILFIGIPIIKPLFGSHGLIALVTFNTVSNLFFFSAGVKIYSLNSKIKWKDFIKTPAIWGAFIGFALFALQVKLPGILSVPITALGDMTAPISMIINGALVYGTPILSLLRQKKNFLFVFVRLVVMPFAVILIMMPFIHNPVLRGIFILMGGMPSGAINSVFADLYTGEGQVAAQYIILSTILSMGTLPLLTFFM